MKFNFYKLKETITELKSFNLLSEEGFRLKRLFVSEGNCKDFIRIAKAFDLTQVKSLCDCLVIMLSQILDLIIENKLNRRTGNFIELMNHKKLFWL
jgi:hypothetical protein